MALTVLFWNFNIAKGDSARALASSHDHADLLALLARDQNADLIVLAECNLPVSEVLASLRRIFAPEYVHIKDPHPKITWFSRLKNQRLASVMADGRTSIKQLVDTGGEHADVLLAATHFVDPYHTSVERQRESAENLRSLIESSENRPGIAHQRTILFGDFNMNPYHIAMTDQRRGLGAIMHRELTLRHYLTTKIPAKLSASMRPCLFYNPMWALMGHHSAPGTFYWKDKEPDNPYWNTLDGVLVRPALLPYFPADSDNPAIIDALTDALGRKQPLIRMAEKHHKIAYSDHLPIRFRFDLPPRKGAD
jgi:hypothetical protein